MLADSRIAGRDSRPFAIVRESRIATRESRPAIRDSRTMVDVCVVVPTYLSLCMYEIRTDLFVRPVMDVNQRAVGTYAHAHRYVCMHVCTYIL